MKCNMGTDFVTERELAIVTAFKDVTFALGTSQKRFAQNMMFLAEHSPNKDLSEKQRRYLTILAWRYRRQMPATLAYPVVEGDEGIVHGFENAGRRPPMTLNTPEGGR